MARKGISAQGTFLPIMILNPPTLLQNSPEVLEGLGVIFRSSVCPLVQIYYTLHLNIVRG